MLDQEYREMGIPINADFRQVDKGCISAVIIDEPVTHSLAMSRRIRHWSCPGLSMGFAKILSP